MTKNDIYIIIDELKKCGIVSDILTRDRVLNYIEANVDEIVECYEELEDNNE